LNELLLVLVGILLAMTAGAAVEYHRRLKSAKKQYEKAREAVEDIVVSFNRQFRQEAEKLELVAYKVEAVSSKSDNALKKAEEVEKKMPDLISRISTVVEDRQKAVSSLEEIDRKVRDVAVSQEALVARLSTIEEQARQLSLAPEAKIEAVIPIKREKALAPLTETELSALEMLALEGPKTAPDIKERIKLSREHTARLMKKLYEGGYLERDTTKIPFKYRVKEEMSKLLKKTETSAT
jgi:predicted HTH transcriptional regulator